MRFTHLRRYYYDELFLITLSFLGYFIVLYLCFYILG